ncbi:MAG: protein-disulfide isomerase [Nitrosopumilus sp.]|nr:protein-disulfide isomerase [Nitrosopumilus sp.]MDF2423153.1 protein-disulfide isomerase [Nitrosopumilus sp.]MDF2424133.1 protein-disulfide isomerase [Nitrosopumilus sp.]MDF2425994.1 protein-disulfide isomerase [Nitrosopumilus sp.]MDF2427536.1 protein-disulfide isomerase [Nitrosopumilus sp.]
MGRKERRDRELKRDNYATKHSAEKKKHTLIAIGVISLIAVIVGYSGYLFLNMTETAPGGPENAGALGSEHSHTAILVKIFGDTFDFDGPAFQIKSSWIHFEGRDGTTIHKHATGVNLGYLFDTLSIGLDDQCYRFPDGKQFCSNEDYKLKFFVNGEQVPDIRDYETMEGDRVLIVYGGETAEEIDAYLMQLDSQELIK